MLSLSFIWQSLSCFFVPPLLVILHASPHSIVEKPRCRTASWQGTESLAIRRHTEDGPETERRWDDGMEACAISWSVKNQKIHGETGNG